MNDTQLICSINPDKFKSLLSSKASLIGFFKNCSSLSNSQHIVYIDEDGRTIIDEYSEEKATAAKIILVPETYKFNYRPRKKYKVLYHSTNISSSQMEYLKTGDLCEGFEMQQEEKGSSYDEIANFIKI